MVAYRSLTCCYGREESESERYTFGFGGATVFVLRFSERWRELLAVKKFLELLNKE